MFKVPIDKIIPVTNARAKISSLVKNVQETRSFYVLTRGGKPAAILASVDVFEKMDAESEQNNQNKNNSKKIDDEPQESVINTPEEIPAEEIEQNVESLEEPSNVVNDEQPVKISIN